MRRVLLAAALVAIATPSAARSKRRGKVVRIERARTRGKGALRMCSNPQADGKAVCYGQARPWSTTTVMYSWWLRSDSSSTPITVSPLSGSRFRCRATTRWMIAPTLSHATETSS